MLATRAVFRSPSAAIRSRPTVASRSPSAATRNLRSRRSVVAGVALVVAEAAVAASAVVEGVAAAVAVVAAKPAVLFLVFLLQKLFLQGAGPTAGSLFLSFFLIPYSIFPV